MSGTSNPSNRQISARGARFRLPARVLCGLAALCGLVMWAGAASPVARASGLPPCSAQPVYFVAGGTKPDVGIVTQSTPALTSSQLANHAALVAVDGGAGVPSCVGSYAAIYSKQDYQGVCLDLAGDDPDVTAQSAAIDLGATWFPVDSNASVLMLSRCGSQLVLYENADYNLAPGGPVCSGFGCFPYLAGCYASLIGGPTTCHAPPRTGGRIAAFSVGDPQITGRSVIQAASIPNFDEFGASSLLLPDGGAAAVYTKPDFQGQCLEMFGGANEAVGSLGVAGGFPDNGVHSIQLLRGCDPAVYFFTGPIGDGIVEGTATHDLPDLTVNAAGEEVYGTTVPSLSNATGEAVSVFSQPNYMGTCTVLPADGSGTELLHDTTVGSIRFGANACDQTGQVYMYRSEGFAGTPFIEYGDNPDLESDDFGQAAYSLVNGTSGTISVYSDLDYTGTCVNVPADSALPNLGQTVIGDATISSVRRAPCPPAIVLGYGASSATQSLAHTGNIPSVAVAIPAGTKLFTVANNTASTISIYSLGGYQGPCQNIAPGSVGFVSASGQMTADATNQLMTAFAPASIKASAACPRAVELFSGAGFSGPHAIITRTTGVVPAPARIVRALLNNTGMNVAVYEGKHDTARCQTLAPGQSIANLAGSEIGTLISSLRIGSACRWQMILFQHADYTGRQLILYHGMPDLAKRTSFLSGRLKVVPTRYEVALVNNFGTPISLYRGTNYSGACENVPPQTGIPSLAANTGAPDVDAHVVRPHHVRSIKVGPCPRQLLLFSGRNYTGTMLDVRGGQSPNIPAQLGIAPKAVDSIVNNTGGPVNLYAAIDFGGKCERLLAGTRAPDTPSGALPLASGPIVSSEDTVLSDQSCPTSAVELTTVIVPPGTPAAPPVPAPY